MPLTQNSANLSTGENNKLAMAEKTVSLAVNILNGKSNVSVIEMNLTMANTLESLNLKYVFKGEEKATIAFGVVKVLVGRFMDSFGFATKMNESQLDTLTVDTLESFKYETLEDIILFFKMARTGQFGSTGRGVDSNLIYGDWFPKYLELKSIEREKKIQREQAAFKENKLTSADIKKAYEKLQSQENTFVDKVIVYVEKITDGINREQLEKLIEEWMNDPQKKPYVYHLNKKRLTIK